MKINAQDCVVHILQMPFPMPSNILFRASVIFLAMSKAKSWSIYRDRSDIRMIINKSISIKAYPGDGFFYATDNAPTLLNATFSFTEFV
jgi:hypothetical protein